MKLSKLKICFVYPDFENVGVELLMSLCLNAGHKIDLVTYQAESSYLGGNQKEISYKDIARKIIKTKPDIVAFSCVTDNYQYQLKCAQAVKAINPKMFTIFGGIHVTAASKSVLQENAVDAIAIGEAEVSFLEFLGKCQKDSKKGLTLPRDKVKGIVFKRNQKIIGQFVEGELIDLDSLPNPYKDPFFPDSLPASEYKIITSRGCPYSCTYCFNSVIHRMRGRGFRIRQRSVNHVLGELLWAKEKFKIKNIFFIDDSFTTNNRWILEFCQRYKEEINLPFACIANPDYLNEKVVSALKSAGCKYIQIGIQSLSRKITKEVINRRVTKRKITHGIKLLKNAGIMVQVDHMLGIPGDTIKYQEEAILYYNQSRPDIISVFWLTYYPGAEIIKLALEKGILTNEDIKNVENGIRPEGRSVHDGGSLKDPRPFYSLQFLMNYLPFLPKGLVSLLINKHWYRFFSIRNYFFSTALPRVILSIFDKRYFIGRTYLLLTFRFLLVKLNFTK
jgi:anaerobic magnesium-protoporphyrin IX monomethyl ester cyclase